MKKVHFIEAVQRLLPNKVHPGTLSVYIGRGFNQIIYETFRKNLSDLDLFSKTYSGIEVKKDKQQNLYYCELPVAIVQLPNAGDGVRNISTMAGKGLEFIAINSNLQMLHEDLEVRDVDGPIPFMVMNGRVEFGNKSPIEDVSKVKLTLVPQFEELDMLDEFYIPAGKDEVLMELVLKFATPALPEKEINDQSQKTK